MDHRSDEYPGNLTKWSGGFGNIPPQMANRGIFQTSERIVPIGTNAVKEWQRTGGGGYFRAVAAGVTLNGGERKKVVGRLE